ncbi:MAG: hypothetical protein ACJ70U_03325 [Nitrososphaera sp.]
MYKKSRKNKGLLKVLYLHTNGNISLLLTFQLTPYIINNINENTRRITRFKKGKDSLVENLYSFFEELGIPGDGQCQ